MDNIFEHIRKQANAARDHIQQTGGIKPLLERDPLLASMMNEDDGDETPQNLAVDLPLIAALITETTKSISLKMLEGETGVPARTLNNLQNNRIQRLHMCFKKKLVEYYGKRIVIRGDDE